MTAVHPIDLPTILQRCRGAVGYAAFFSLCINLLIILFSIYSLQVLDRVFSSRSYDTLLMLTLLMVVAVIFLGLFTAVRALILERTGAWIDRTLAPDLLARAVRVAASGGPIAAAQQQRDLGNIRQFIGGTGMTTILDMPWSLMYLLVVFAISVPLGWLALFGCLLMIALGVMTEMISKRPVAQQQRYNLETLSVIDTTARHAETVEAMGMTRALLGRWRQSYDRQQDFHEQIGHRSALLQSITKTVRMGLQIAVTGAAGYLVLEYEMTAGGMIAASILSARAFAPFENAIGFWKQMLLARSAYERLKLTHSVALPPVSEMSLPSPKGTLSVEQLSYQPAGLSKPLLHNVTFSLQTGESLGIIGPSGAGKSTLAKLLTGITVPTFGSVRLDGNDLAIWNKEELGPYIGYLPQQCDLFPGTVGENIARFYPAATAEAVIEAAEMAGVHRMIQQLPMGYDTVWDPARPLLSPGQKQRIALARAVYAKPRLVVLDEPNVNMDGEGEMALTAMLQLLKLQKITVVIVAHKPSIVQCLDKALVLQRGMVEKFGRRQKVLQPYVPAQTASAS